MPEGKQRKTYHARGRSNAPPPGAFSNLLCNSNINNPA